MVGAGAPIGTPPEMESTDAGEAREGLRKKLMEWEMVKRELLLLRVWEEERAWEGEMVWLGWEVDLWEVLSRAGVVWKLVER